MLYMLENCGIFGWLLLLILLANAVIFIINAQRLRSAKAEDRPKIQYGTNAVLFWGGVCALLGFLGQYCGIYHALNVLKTAEVISPNLLAEGVAISFTTTIMGMAALLLSALGWFVLHNWHRKLSRSWAAD